MACNMALYLQPSDPYRNRKGKFKKPTQQQVDDIENAILNKSYTAIRFMSLLSKKAIDNCGVIVHPSEYMFKWEKRNEEGLREIYIEVGVHDDSRTMSCYMHKDCKGCGWNNMNVFDANDGATLEVLDQIESFCDSL